MLLHGQGTITDDPYADSGQNRTSTTNGLVGQDSARAAMGRSPLKGDWDSGRDRFPMECEQSAAIAKESFDALPVQSAPNLEATSSFLTAVGKLSDVRNL